jgi:hypothetical protein
MAPKSPLLLTAVQLGLLVWVIYIIFIGGQTAQGIYDHHWRAVTLWLNAAILGGWLLWQGWRGPGLPRTPLNRPLLALVAAWLAAALFSVNPVVSVGTLAFWGTYLLLFYLAADLGRRPWLVELTLTAIIGASGLVWTLGLWQLSRWVAGLEPVPALLQGQAPPPALLRLTVLGNANILAGFVALVLPLALYKLTTARLPLTRGLLILWLGMLVFTGLLTQSRGGMLAMAAAVGLYALFWLAPQKFSGPLVPKSHWLLATLTVLLVAGGWLAYSWRGLGAAASIRQQVGLGALKTWLAHPLTGSGPGTLGQELLARQQPLDMIWADAHNVPLTMAAETGLLGAAALLWLAWAAVNAARSTFADSSPPADTLRRAACLAALLGFAMHGLVDYLVKFPLMMVLVAILAGFWLAPQNSGAAARRLAVAGAGLVLLAVTAAGWWSVQHIAAYNQAVQAANGGNWALAYTRLQQADALAPGTPFYARQLGVAAGFLAQTEPAYQANAITHYRAALAQVDRLAVDHANLACLLWANGQADDAITEMTAARTLDPYNSVYRLNLGAYLEAGGQFEAALPEYVRVLAAQPDTQQSAFWQETPARAAALPELLPQVEPSPAQTYLRQSETALAQGNLPAAAQNSAAALWLAATPAAYLQAGRVAAAQGDAPAALAHFEAAFTALTAQPLESLSRYATEVARRRPLPAAYLPCLRRIYPDNLLTDLALAHGGLLAHQDEPGEAAAVYRRLLSLVPQAGAVKTRLAELCRAHLDSCDFQAK